MEQLKLKSGMPGVMIPYKSSNEMMLSIIEGQSMMTICRSAAGGTAGGKAAR